MRSLGTAGEASHIWREPGQEMSEKYGLTVHLCITCHRDNKKGVHADAKKSQRLHRIGQAAFEKRYGRQKFFDVFGRYYLADTETAREAPEEEEPPGIIFLDR